MVLKIHNLLFSINTIKGSFHILKFMELYNRTFCVMSALSLHFNIQWIFLS